MSPVNESSASSQITVVGGGIAGLVAAIACAEEGAKVRLVEAHERLGGRARSTDGPYKANLGPHAMYNDGAFWRWMRERDILPAHRKREAVGRQAATGRDAATHPAVGHTARDIAFARP